MPAISINIPDPVEASILAPIGTFFREPDTQLIEGPGWYQIVTPSIRDISMNQVILSRVPATEADRKVDEALEIYSQHALLVKWMTGPMSTPEVEARIRPLAETSWPFRGMTIETQTEISAPSSIHVSAVTSENFDEFVDTFVKGWELQHIKAKFEVLLRQAFSTGTHTRYYLAKQGSIPVGTSGAVFKDGYGYLTSAVILEDFRGTGAYRSLLRARLEDLHRSGRSFAVTQARESTSAPILAKLGFRTTFTATVYRLKPY